MPASPTLSPRSGSAAAAFADSAAPAWRVRWFWRWQAWRLRHAREHEASHGVVLCNSLHMLEQLGQFDGFCNLHRRLVREAPMVGLDSPIGFSRRLKRELSGSGVMALLRSSEGPGGYAWGRSGSLDEALDHYQQVLALNHLRSEDWKLLQRRLAGVVGSAPVLALNGLGLAPAWRKGFSPLKQLLKPLLEMGLEHGASRALWWTPRGGALHALSLGFGALPVLETARIVCFVLADTRPLGRVFAALPAGEISDLLARVAPARPPDRPLLRPRVVPGSGTVIGSGTGTGSGSGSEPRGGAAA